MTVSWGDSDETATSLAGGSRASSQDPGQRRLERSNGIAGHPDHPAASPYAREQGELHLLGSGGVAPGDRSRRGKFPLRLRGMRCRSFAIAAVLA